MPRPRTIAEVGFDSARMSSKLMFRSKPGQAQHYPHAGYAARRSGARRWRRARCTSRHRAERQSG